MFKYSSDLAISVEKTTSAVTKIFEEGNLLFLQRHRRINDCLQEFCSVMHSSFLTLKLPRST